MEPIIHFLLTLPLSHHLMPLTLPLSHHLMPLTLPLSHHLMPLTLPLSHPLTSLHPLTPLTLPLSHPLTPLTLSPCRILSCHCRTLSSVQCRSKNKRARQKENNMSLPPKKSKSGESLELTPLHRIYWCYTLPVMTI